MRWLAILLATLAATCLAGEGDQHLKASDADLRWFRDAKFGVFICWGPVSIVGTEIGWSRRGPRPGHRSQYAKSGVPMEVYDSLYRKFNPTRFSAREWVQVIRDAGAKYMIFLTKHHDGFCMFDSQHTDYKITNAPLGRDVTGELAEACQEAGIRIFWYYSQPDWRHPDYRTGNHARYVQYLHSQIRELCTTYGKIDGIWFDGLGGRSQDWDSPTLFRMIRALQPGILINNRAGLRGDFDTPEQRIGRFELGRPWESCITMSGGWSWRPGTRVKSLKECLHLLIRCAGGGGNLALDTGPMPDGRIDPGQAERYREMGAWLQQYGDSIYATTGGPYMPGRWGVSTRKANKVYVHVLRWEDDKIVLPPLGKSIVGCTALTGGVPTLRQGRDALEIGLAGEHHDEVNTIIVLELSGPAQEIQPISSLERGSITLGKKASASSTWSGGYRAGMAFDGDERTRWGAGQGKTTGWLAVDLGRAMTFSRALILENPWNRVRRFQLQYRDGEAWRTFHEGTELGECCLRFEPVTAQHVRLNVLAATDVPTIWEVQLFPPSK